MRRLSSQMTFFYKRVFPVLWFGILALIFAVAILTTVAGGQFPLPVLIVPVILGTFGYYLFRRLLFDLVDEVWDDGEAVIIKNGGEEERVALSEIMNVSYTVLVNPPRVTLMLRRESRFGREVTFLPPQRFSRFTPNPLITELIERIDAKRRR
jgi:hypothetical protein